MGPQHEQFGSETPLATGQSGASRASAPNTLQGRSAGTDGPTLGQLAEVFAAEPELIRACSEATDGIVSVGQEGALAAALEASAAHPDYADLHCFAASAALRLGRLSEAEALLGRARELNPTYVEALVLSAKVAQAAQDPERAIMWLERVIAAGGDYADVHVMLAGLRRTRGETELARRAYRRAIELNPEFGAARAGLAALSTSDPGGGAA